MRFPQVSLVALSLLIPASHSAPLAEPGLLGLFGGGGLLGGGTGSSASNLLTLSTAFNNLIADVNLSGTNLAGVLGGGNTTDLNTLGALLNPILEGITAKVHVIVPLAQAAKLTKREFPYLKRQSTGDISTDIQNLLLAINNALDPVANTINQIPGLGPVLAGAVVSLDQELVTLLTSVGDTLDQALSPNTGLLTQLGLGSTGTSTDPTNVVGGLLGGVGNLLQSVLGGGLLSNLGLGSVGSLLNGLGLNNLGLKKEA